MVREFEGKTEREAIERAIEELNLDRTEFDVEVIEGAKKGLLFKKGNVKIRVHLTDDDDDTFQSEGDLQEHEIPAFLKQSSVPIDPDETEQKIIDFLSETIDLMGYSGTVSLLRREDKKFVLGIDSQNSGILIGRKGKNLDAFQLLANVFLGRINANTRVIVDAENYRARREESLIRLANKTAEQVRRSRGSHLLEPMNPFERRLIHTTLNELEDIDTKSEGDGLYKQVRVIYRGI